MIRVFAFPLAFTASIGCFFFAAKSYEIHEYANMVFGFVGSFGYIIWMASVVYEPSSHNPIKKEAMRK
jgi:hypothetical protein